MPCHNAARTTRASTHRVVQGRSAESLLDRVAGATPANPSATERVQRLDRISYESETAERRDGLVERFRERHGEANVVMLPVGVVLQSEEIWADGDDVAAAHHPAPCRRAVAPSRTKNSGFTLEGGVDRIGAAAEPWSAEALTDAAARISPTA